MLLPVPAPSHPELVMFGPVLRRAYKHGAVSMKRTWRYIRREMQDTQLLEEIKKEVRYIPDLLKCFCTLYCFHEYVVDVTILSGPSMLPTFNQAGDLVLVSCLHLTVGWPVRVGDVVIAKSPTDPTATICKRILGLPGDKILLQRQYWHEEERLIEVPPGMMWLEGDNPYNSTDSRTYGPVPMSILRGVVVCKLYPFRNIGPVSRGRFEREPGSRYPPLNYAGVTR